MARVLTDEQIKIVCNRYKAGEDTTTIAKDYPVTGAALIGLLKRRNIPRRSPSECHQKYNLDKYFFDKIDTEEKAYWLGFIYADGCNTAGALSFHLALKDKSHLEKFKKALNSNHPIFASIQYGHRQNSREKIYFHVYLRIKNKYLVASLEKVGVVPRKTLTLEFPLISDVMPYPLANHFIRGYFDGDGSVFFNDWRNRQGRVSFCGTQAMLSTIAYVMDIKYTGFRKKHNANIYELDYGGSRLVERIYNFLYTDATVWLDRKKEKFEEILSWLPAAIKEKVK